jgi:hypothetical protein
VLDTGEDDGCASDEKEMGFITASAMDPLQYEKMDREVRTIFVWHPVH